MSLSVETRIKLMAYADGELEGSDRAAVEALLASDVNAARFVHDLVTLSAVVSRGHAERDGAKIASFDVAASIMSTLDSLRPTACGDAASLARQTRQTRQTSPSRVRKRVPKRTWYWGAGGVAAALAMAAAVFVVVRPQASSVPVQMALSATASSEQAVPLAEPRIEPSIEVDVNAADSPGQLVSLLYLPSEKPNANSAGNQASTSVVLWVNETGEK